MQLKEDELARKAQHEAYIDAKLQQGWTEFKEGELFNFRRKYDQELEKIRGDGEEQIFKINNSIDELKERQPVISRAEFKDLQGKVMTQVRPLQMFSNFSDVFLTAGSTDNSLRLRTWRSLQHPTRIPLDQHQSSQSVSDACVTVILNR